ncbi:hypothetical protein Q5O14_11715 [Eubacteriaceae bacterium ES2]|nr:hypothetical protein Q5O14_11715 [Eubacteriaceae bacterium ES2]
MEIKHKHDESCKHDHSLQHDNGITSYNHDKALVCSGERNMVGDPEEVKKKLADQINLLVNWIEQEDGIIGHIKAIVKYNECSMMLSTTGDNLTIKEMIDPKVQVSLVAIVFNMNVNSLEKQLDLLFDKLEKKKWSKYDNNWRKN